MKKTLISIVGVVGVFLLMSNCSNFKQISGVEVVSEDNSSFSFYLDLSQPVNDVVKEKKLAKVAVDGLIPKNKKKLAQYRASKVNWVGFFLWDPLTGEDSPDNQVGSPKYMFEFKSKNHVFSGKMNVAPGDYFIRVNAKETISGSLSDYSFTDTLTVSVESGKNKEISFSLKEKDDMTASFRVHGIDLDDQVYSYNVYGDCIINGSWGSSAKMEGGIFYFRLSIRKQSNKDVKLKILDRNGDIGVYYFPVDIMDVIDDGYIDVHVNSASISSNISFEHDKVPVVDSTFPANGDIDIPLDIGSIDAYFNKTDDFKWNVVGFKFSVVSEDGSDTLSGAGGRRGDSFYRALDNGYVNVPLKPDMKYICSISGLRDEYGNLMEAYSWSFTTVSK